jgi:hypothetical protein
MTLLLAAVLAPGTALAQGAQQPGQQPPIQQQWQRQGVDPLLSPNAPVSPDAPQAAPAAPSAQQEGPDPFTRPNVWVPAKEARIQALDKINAQSSDLVIKVGQSATYGSLTISVKACVVRPSDQPPDAAAYLDVTDSHPDSEGFSGWMLAKEPSVSMMQNPIYDLRVSGCA